MPNKNHHSQQKTNVVFPVDALIVTRAPESLGDVENPIMRVDWGQPEPSNQILALCKRMGFSTVVVIMVDPARDWSLFVELERRGLTVHLHLQGWLH